MKNWPKANFLREPEQLRKSIGAQTGSNTLINNNSIKLFTASNLIVLIRQLTYIVGLKKFLRKKNFSGQPYKSSNLKYMRDNAEDGVPTHIFFYQFGHLDPLTINAKLK